MLEQLESRRLCSATVTPINGDGSVKIDLGNGGQSVEIVYDGNYTERVGFNNAAYADYKSGGPMVVRDAVTKASIFRFDSEMGSNITINGGNGADRVTVYGQGLTDADGNDVRGAQGWYHLTFNGDNGSDVMEVKGQSIGDVNNVIFNGGNGNDTAIGDVDVFNQ